MSDAGWRASASSVRSRSIVGEPPGQHRRAQAANRARGAAARARPGRARGADRRVHLGRGAARALAVHPAGVRLQPAPGASRRGDRRARRRSAQGPSARLSRRGRRRPRSTCSSSSSSPRRPGPRATRGRRRSGPPVPSSRCPCGAGRRSPTSRRSRRSRRLVVPLERRRTHLLSRVLRPRAGARAPPPAAARAGGGCGAASPLDERLTGQLMVALYRNGRQAEALETYRRTAEAARRGARHRPGRPAARPSRRPCSGRTRLLDLGAADVDPGVTLQRDDRGQRGAVLVLPNGVELELQARTWVIGRHPDCQVVLADPEASRRHAEVRPVPGGYVLVDLGSTNGTRVADEDVREHRLEDGDRIGVGDDRPRLPGGLTPDDRPAGYPPGVFGTAALRVLDAHDRASIAEVLARDPVVNVFVASRVKAGAESAAMGGELWGWTVDGRLEALCFAGANLVPVDAGPEARAGVRRAGPQAGPALLLDRRSGRDGRAAVAAARAVAGAPLARSARASRTWPSTADPDVEPDPLVRRVRPDELDILYPACGGHVHRGGRHLAGGRRPGMPTGPGSPSSSPRAGPTPASRAAGSSSRPRSAPSATTPARSRASGSPRASAAGGSRRAGLRRSWCAARRRLRPGGQPLRQRLQRRGPQGVRAGRVSSSSRPSPRSCSRPRAHWRGASSAPCADILTSALTRSSIGRPRGPAHVDAVPPHAARGPGRRGGAEPPAAGPRRLHPPGGARAATPGCRSAGASTRKVERIVREEMDAMGAQEVHFPALLPREPYEAQRPVDRVRRRHLPAAGPQGRGPPARADARGDVHAAGEGPVLLVQGPAGLRSTRSRRSSGTSRGRGPGLLRGREFVMKDSYSFDVDDAGLDALVQRAPRGVHQDLRPARPRLRHRLGDVGGDGRLAQRGVPGARGERRGHVRPLHVVRLRREHRGGHACRLRRRSRTTTRPAAHVEDTPDTPTIDTLVSLANRAATCVAPTVTGPPATR